MATGLLALLDDIAALVKVTAATLDDIPTQVSKTTAKVSGVVIDDAAVTPKYVVGLDPKRELSIIYNIARRSLINKLLILGPAALVLGAIAPKLIPYILMLGGAYLCFEGYEKVYGMLVPHDHEAATGEAVTITPEELERERIDSAVQTDMILSAEIMAITYATVLESSLTNKIVVLTLVAILITVAVYGFVALLVKMDDIGVYLAKRSKVPSIRALGRGIVHAMPSVLKVIGIVGTAAMLWVGAEIIAHGIPFLHHALEDLQHAIGEPAMLAWLAKAAACAIGGLGIGAIIGLIVPKVKKLLPRRKTE